MGTHGATCVHTLITATRDIPLAAWNVERFGMVCTQAQNFANLKAALEKLCHQTKDCKFQQLDEFYKSLDKIKAPRP